MLEDDATDKSAKFNGTILIAAFGTATLGGAFSAAAADDGVAGTNVGSSTAAFFAAFDFAGAAAEEAVFEEAIEHAQTATERHEHKGPEQVG